MKKSEIGGTLEAWSRGGVSCESGIPSICHMHALTLLEWFLTSARVVSEISSLPWHREYSEASILAVS
jgi:hypothetical protein